jgi:hypothetical protein
VLVERHERDHRQHLAGELVVLLHAIRKLKRRSLLTCVEQCVDLRLREVAVARIKRLVPDEFMMDAWVAIRCHAGADHRLKLAEALPVRRHRELHRVERSNAPVCVRSEVALVFSLGIQDVEAQAVCIDRLAGRFRFSTSDCVIQPVKTDVIAPAADADVVIIARRKEFIHEACGVLIKRIPSDDTRRKPARSEHGCPRNELARAAGILLEEVDVEAFAAR